jgi:protein involved in ribonucleotide reduction
MKLVVIHLLGNLGKSVIHCHPHGNRQPFVIILYTYSAHTKRHVAQYIGEINARAADFIEGRVPNLLVRGIILVVEAARWILSEMCGLP